jgi:hypothetical protein
MALFVEVESVDKNCTVIINLDQIVEIAPLAAGGCALFMSDSGGVGAKASLLVKNSYDEFKQFAMQTVSAEDIAKRFPKKKEEPKIVVEPSGRKNKDGFAIPTMGDMKVVDE